MECWNPATLESCPVAWQPWPWNLGTLEPAVGKAGLIKSLLATSSNKHTLLNRKNADGRCLSNTETSVVPRRYSKMANLAGALPECQDTKWTRMTPSGKRAPTYLAMEFQPPWERGPKSNKGPKRGWKGEKKVLKDPDGDFKMVKTKDGWVKISASESSAHYIK